MIFFLKVIEEHIAGDPMNEHIRWVKLTRSEISECMKKEGIIVSRNIVKKLLKNHKFVKRKMLPKTRTGNFEDREKQFEIISNLSTQFKKSKNPIISMDTKKKEFFRKLLS